jgi:hypothetical protein
MAACNVATGDEMSGVPGFTGQARYDADYRHPDIRLCRLNLHAEVRDASCARNSRNTHEAAISIVVDARRFGVWPERIFLHNPEVSAAVVEQRHCIVDHTAVDASHRQRYADQEAKPHAREHKLAPRVHDVATGEADQRGSPTRRSTILMRLIDLSGFWL